MTRQPLDIDHLKAWIGKQESVEDTITLFPARALGAALDNNRLLEKGDNLPPFWEWMYFLATPRASQTGADGHPAKGGFLPPVPLPRRMWAAGKQKHLRPLVIGDEAKRVSTIKSVDLKQGSTGTLVFVTVGHEILQHGERCIEQEQNLVYREQPAADSPTPPAKQPPEAFKYQQLITPDPVLLYRFSALTYNGHRIHYDRRYAMEEELYPALVVHGPLLVTLLLELARQELADKTIADFSFRAVRPTFDSHAFKVQADLSDQKLSIWSVDHEGALCMQLTANVTAGS